MLLEKIKKNAGKLSFFVINALLVFSGAMYLKQENLQASLDELSAQKNTPSKPAETPAPMPEAVVAQDNITAIRQEKIDSIASNPAVVTKKTTITTAKTVPSTTTTKKVSTSSTSTKSTKSVAKTSAPAPAPVLKPAPTPAPAPAPAPAPTKTTKTS